MKYCSNAAFHAICKSHWWYPVWHWCKLALPKLQALSQPIMHSINGKVYWRAAVGLRSCSVTHLASWKSQARVPQRSFSRHWSLKQLAHQCPQYMYVGRYQTNLLLSQSLKFALNQHFGPRFACHLGSKLTFVCHRLRQMYAGIHHVHQMLVQNGHTS